MSLEARKRLWSTAVLIISLSAGGAAAEGIRAGATLWSADSWVEVRQEAADKAPVTAGLPTNTKVTVSVAEGPWCRVEAWPSIRGWIKCNTLVPSQLTLENLGTTDASEARKRAFWIAPTWARLVAIGHGLPDEVLTEAQRTAELQAQEIRRHEVPFFEAMKKRLAEGVALRADREIDAKLIAPGPDDADLTGVLPAARSSLFRSRREFAVSPTPDQVAAVRNSTLALKTVTDGPSVRDSDVKAVVDGAWDIGQADLRFTPAAILYSISADGALAASSVPTAAAEGGQRHYGCVRPNPVLEFPFWKAKDLQPLPGYPVIPAQAVIARFFTAHDLKPGTVQVVTRVLRSAVRSIDGRWIPEQTVIYEIDLDGDGNADMVEVKGQAAGEKRDYVARVRLFVNAGGSWSKEVDFTEAECS